jgi:hypothetical protein
MNMIEHILAALREQFTRWEELLAHLSAEQITTPSFDLDWSVKDVINHLWGWQQISVARMNAGLLNREPEFPTWLIQFPGNWDEDASQTNAWIYKNFHNRSWSETYQNWREGFFRLLSLGEMLSERNVLDGDRYAWLNGYSLAAILVASYEHHQEHLEKLTVWLQQHDQESKSAKSGQCQ